MQGCVVIFSCIILNKMLHCMVMFYSYVTVLTLIMYEMNRQVNI